MALCYVAACAVSVGGGGGVAPFIAFTIGNKSFVFSLGNAGVFAVRRGAPPVKGGLRVENLFEPPADRPVSGDLTVNPMNVRVTPLSVGKPVAPMQGISGSFVVVVLLGNVGDDNPCETGTNVGTIHATVTNDAVSLDTTALALPAAALVEAITGDFSVCLEVSGDIDATITITELGITFGPAETDGGEANENGGGIDTTSASLTFHNQDVQPIHFLGAGDDFGPQNRVEAGQTSTDVIENAIIGLPVNIRAGRNGTVLAETDCPVVNGPGYTATVVWNGFTVSCEADQGTAAGGIIQVPINSAGNATAVTDTIGGVDYGIVGVMEVLSTDGTIPAPDVVTVDLAELGLEYVETIYLATHSSHSWDIPNGVKVATFTCNYVEGGSPTTLDMVMGSNTAEWAFENPQQFEFMGGPVSHNQPTILTSAPTTVDSTEEYDGHDFAASLSLDTSRTLASLTLELEDPVAVAATRTPPNAAFFLLGQAHMGITLEGPAGTPDVDTGATGGTSGGEALAGCWQVTVHVDKDGELKELVLVLDIDAAGDLATLWFETESGDPPQTQLIEFARFTEANAGLFAALITDAQQSVSVNAAGTEADISFSFNIQADEQSNSLALNITDAALSGNPPASFVSNTATSTDDTELVPPAEGRRTNCPDVSQETVISQEEFEVDFEFDDLCGSGTGTIMPMIFLALGWMKLRK
ncbi:MAG TPA: hypothetical protein VM243_06985 [Phycisphaerae bacterium]|nr:hypothetical protein [Phycisphaerae bacterium]